MPDCNHRPIPLRQNANGTILAKCATCGAALLIEYKTGADIPAKVAERQRAYYEVLTSALNSGIVQA